MEKRVLLLRQMAEQAKSGGAPSDAAECGRQADLAEKRQPCGNWYLIRNFSASMTRKAAVIGS